MVRPPRREKPAIEPATGLATNPAKSAATEPDERPATRSAEKPMAPSRRNLVGGAGSAAAEDRGEPTSKI